MLIDKLKQLADYWRSQSELWNKQEQDWHEVVLFCRQKKEEIRKIRDGLVGIKV